MLETNPNVFVFIFCIHSKTAFQLNLKKCFAVYVVGNKISALPIVAETNGYEAIVSKDSRNLLKIKVFLVNANLGNCI